MLISNTSYLIQSKQQTDRKHFKEVGAWTAKFAKDKGIIPPLTLIYSAWCHGMHLIHTISTVSAMYINN